MKILEISFKNINSLEGSHKISFEGDRFKNGCLFAIVGPTGSGKSTILDIITLAIYSQMPRMKNINKNEIEKSGAVITYGKTQSYARVKYQCSRGIFISEWSIRIKRTGTIDSIKMMLFDSNGTAIVDGEKKVVGQNIENIGLTYEQFTKSVMLVQGEFAKFLKVDRKERSALLEQITGTEIYRTIGKRVYERNKEAELVILGLEKEIEAYGKNVVDKEQEEELREKLSKNKEKVDDLNRQRDRAKELFKIKAEIEDTVKKLDKLDIELRENERKNAIFREGQGKELELHLKTEVFLSELQQWDKARGQLEKNKYSLDKKEQEKAKGLYEMEKIVESISEIISQRVGKDDAVEKIELFVAEVEELESDKKQKISNYKIQMDNANKEYFKLFGSKIDVKDISKIEKDLFRIRGEVIEKSNDIRRKFVDVDWSNVLQEIEKKVEEGKKMIQAREMSATIEKYRGEIEAKISKNKELEDDMAVIPQTIHKLNTQILSKRENLALLKEKKRIEDSIKSLEQYRNKLVEGKHCPLCGSTHHPWGNVVEVDVGKTQQMIQTQETELLDLEKNISAEQAKLSSAEKNIQALKLELKQIGESLKEKENAFEKSFGSYCAPQYWQDRQSEIDREVIELKKYGKMKEDLEILEELIPQIGKIIRLIEQGREVSEKIRIKTKGIEDIVKQAKDKSSKLIEINTKVGSVCHNIEEIKTEMKHLHTEILNIEEKLKEKVLENGFFSIEQALEVRMDSEKASLLKKKKEELENEYNTLRGSQKSYLEIYKKQKARDTEKKIEDIEREINQTTQEIEILSKEIEQYSMTIKTNEQNRWHIDRVRKEIEQEQDKNRVWKTMKDMIGDSTGDKFNKFAQQLTLKHLVVLANRRLLRLSDRYLIDSPDVEQEGENLIIIDRDMGGKRRWVSTLSGGESFIVSLALALALSDLASKNIKIGSLFIDEGFGTLDSESLEQTIGILEKLQYEGERMIGIISHVDALKDRISTQIRLRQKGSGLSSLEFVF